MSNHEATPPIPIELLAPARNADIAIEAIKHGADAVYMGPPTHGARQQAANSIADFRRITDFAHIYGVKVYATVNTLVYDNELEQVVQLVRDLYAAGVDAIIVQDLALLTLPLPPIALHASTQCDIRTPAKARFLQDAGFTQLVLPRELTLGEIAQMRRAVNVPLEAFVHGALCVSFSGDCQASYVITGRSANRGECAQICRYRFNLEDASGNVIVKGKHLLSLRDLNRLDALSKMLDAGITSFKIEGRLKDADYVKNVVAAYSTRLDQIIAAAPGRWERSSHGSSAIGFTPDVTRSFNRGFTEYFLNQPRQGLRMASADTPKFTGRPIGQITKILSPHAIEAHLTDEIANGDGLGYFLTDGNFAGMRVNRAEGSRLYLSNPISGAKPGTELFRNYDKHWNEILARPDTSKRVIEIDAYLRTVHGRLILRLETNTGIFAEIADEATLTEAHSPQQAQRQRIIGKLGDTPFTLRNFNDNAGNCFIPASLLTALRRRACNALMAALHLNHKYLRRDLSKRGPAADHPRYPSGEATPSRHLNIANKVAETFYRHVLATDSPLPKAIEVEQPANETELRVMQTRYCIRRELGACLRTPDAKKLPAKLWLVAGNLRLRLEFDCKNCMMNIYTAKIQKTGSNGI